MKTASWLAAAFAFCFLLGVGFVALTPDVVQAKDNPTPCGTFCPAKIVCQYDASCSPPNEYMHYRCKLWWPEPVDCTGSYTCGCRALGCGGACIPDP